MRIASIVLTAVLVSIFSLDAEAANQKERTSRTLTHGQSVSIYSHRCLLSARSNGSEQIVVKCSQRLSRHYQTRPVGRTYLAPEQTAKITARSCKLHMVRKGAGLMSIKCLREASPTVGGSVAGLSGMVTLQNNGGDSITLTSDGAFTFPAPLADGSSYSVSISTQPAFQTCLVTNGAGTAGPANVTDVAVNCTTNTFTVGGAVSGLSGSLVLQNNNGSNLTVSSNGSFTFANSVADGQGYSVSILSQPAAQTCVVTNGAGTVTAAPVSNVAVSCTTNTYSVGGTVSGLSGTVVLQNNAGNNLSVSSNGNVVFSAPVASGRGYSVAVLTQPAHQTCVVTYGSGVIASSVITNVGVTCTNNTFSVGGAVSGLTGTVALQNNGGDNLAVSSDGSITFSTPVVSGNGYNVTVLTQPTSETCVVVNGSGTIGSTNVTNVSVICSVNTYTIGGTVTGLSGSVALQNNGSDNQTISSNGSFTFSTPVVSGSSYNATVLSQPTVQTCVITNGSGTVGSSNVTNVTVSCSTNPTTLAVSANELALAVGGISRDVTITNTGSETASSLSLSVPTFAGGTQVNTTCGSSLAAGASCNIFITPGGSPTSSCHSPYSTPTPDVITVSAANVASPVSTDILVLAHGCIYQGGFIFGIDDTTASTGSIGGTVLALADQSGAQTWYNSSFSVTNAQSFTNGAANTATIVAAQGLGSYAAYTCDTYEVDTSGNSPCSTGTCYSSWHLPAICEMGEGLQGAGCSAGIPNIWGNLQDLIFGCTGGQCLATSYWSSTEYSATPNTFAFIQLFSSGGSSQYIDNKAGNQAVRCVRQFN